MDQAIVRQESNMLSFSSSVTPRRPTLTPAELLESFARVRPILERSSVVKATVAFGVGLDSVFTCLASMSCLLKAQGHQGHQGDQGGAGIGASAGAASTGARGGCLSMSPKQESLPSLPIAPLDERRWVACVGCGHRRLQERFKGSGTGSCEKCGLASLADVRDSEPVCAPESVHWTFVPIVPNKEGSGSGRSSSGQPERPKVKGGGGGSDRVSAAMERLCAATGHDPTSIKVDYAKGLALSCAVGCLQGRVAAALILAVKPNVLTSPSPIPEPVRAAKFACAACGEAWSRRLESQLCCKLALRSIAPITLKRRRGQ